jgi:alpha-methylacyl-CoA racemase
MDRSAWPDLKAKLAAVIATRTQAEWCDLMEATDVCFAPMLDFDEAPRHPHNAARKAFIEIDGVIQPAPTPRFSRTVSEVRGRPPEAGENNREALVAWGFAASEVEALIAAGTV